MRKAFHIFILTLFVAGILFGAGAQNSARAQSDIGEGTVFKGIHYPVIYYLGSDGKRYVFPNGKIFASWFENFDNVIEIDDSELAKFPIGGNIPYKPGALLVKIPTDPKVYAVGQRGTLRWVKTEDIARKLYGENWNKLVDDLPVAFLTSYVEDSPIETEDDFDPEGEEDSTLSVNDNLGLRFKNRIIKKISLRINTECERIEHRLMKLRRRLSENDIRALDIDTSFIRRCVNKVDDDDDDEDEDNETDERKVEICHIPLRNSDRKHTIEVGKAAARAHLAHGDKEGACEDKENPNDIVAPIITNIETNVHETRATIKWKTNEKSTSQVEYADESLSTATTSLTVLDDSLETSHELDLTDLVPAKEYFFIIESKDAAGNVATTTEHTFITEL